MALISAINPLLTTGWQTGGHAWRMENDSGWRLKDYEARGGYQALKKIINQKLTCLLYTSPSPRDS